MGLFQFYAAFEEEEEKNMQSTFETVMLMKGHRGLSNKSLG